MKSKYALFLRLLLQKKFQNIRLCFPWEYIWSTDLAFVYFGRISSETEFSSAYRRQEVNIWIASCVSLHFHHRSLWLPHCCKFLKAAETKF